MNLDQHLSEHVNSYLKKKDLWSEVKRFLGQMFGKPGSHTESLSWRFTVLLSVLMLLRSPAGENHALFLF